MAGYIYYPDVGILAEMLMKVREIELEVCCDCSR